MGKNMEKKECVQLRVFMYWLRSGNTWRHFLAVYMCMDICVCTYLSGCVVSFQTHVTCVCVYQVAAKMFLILLVASPTPDPCFSFSSFPTTKHHHEN